MYVALFKYKVHTFAVRLKRYVTVMIYFGATLIFSLVAQHDMVAETFNSSPRAVQVMSASRMSGGGRWLVFTNPCLNSSALVTPFQT